MIKAVIFDVDNTLYSYTKAHGKAFAALSAYADKNLGLSPENFENLHKRAERELRAYMGNVAAVHNRLIRYQIMLENSDLPLYPHALNMDELYWNTLIDAAVPSDGALDALKLLKKQGVRIGIGTDMTARIQFKKLTALGLLPYIDFLVSSEEAGAEKPDPVIFRRCAAKAGCKEQECLFVGDSLKKDVLGAEAAGLKAVWYCPDGYRDEADVPQITNLLELPPMVSAL